MLGLGAGPVGVLGQCTPVLHIWNTSLQRSGGGYEGFLSHTEKLLHLGELCRGEVNSQWMVAQQQAGS